jgi:hypothetical protein
MSNEHIGIEELTKKRTPSELHSWVERKIKQVGSTEEGEKALRLHEGLVKQLMEEVYPLALFGFRKFGDTDQVLLQPVIGDQSYDAIVTDLRNSPASNNYVEITQSHEGENDYLRNLVLQIQGYVFPHSPVYKTGTKKTGRQVSIPAKAFEVGEIASRELEKIFDAANRKAGKNYPANTSLIIVFEDGLFFQKAIDQANLDAFVKKYILKLDLRFEALYLVGWQSVFGEFSLGKAT